MRKEYLHKTKFFFEKYKHVCPLKHKYLAVVVETRQVPDFGLIVKNHLYFLGKDWDLLVIHSEQNKKYITEQLKDINNYLAYNIKNGMLTGIQYNNFMTNEWLWENCSKWGKCLVFQTDSLLLRKGIEKWFEYTYVGAPWNTSHINMQGGNGGLSLRDPKDMLRCVRQFKWSMNEYGNEDLFFSKHSANIPVNSIAKEFSVESVFYPKPLGVHACEGHLKREQQEIILNEALKEIA